jgi:hypothetical protein
MRFSLRNQKAHSFLSRSPPTNPFDNHRTYCIWGFGKEFTMIQSLIFFLGSFASTMRAIDGFGGKDGVLGTHRSPSPFSSPLATAMVVATVCTPRRVVSWRLGSFENGEPPHRLGRPMLCCWKWTLMVTLMFWPHSIRSL